MSFKFGKFPLSTPKAIFFSKLKRVANLNFLDPPASAWWRHQRTITSSSFTYCHCFFVKIQIRSDEAMTRPTIVDDVTSDKCGADQLSESIIKRDEERANLILHTTSQWCHDRLSWQPTGGSNVTMVSWNLLNWRQIDLKADDGTGALTCQLFSCLANTEPTMVTNLLWISDTCSCD